MSAKKKIVTTATAVMLAVGSLFMIPQAAIAANESVNMTLVCQMTMNNAAYAAKLTNANSAYGWKCYNRGYPEQYFLGPHFNADINYYCMVTYGRHPYAQAAYFSNVNDPYSWRCR